MTDVCKRAFAITEVYVGASEGLGNHLIAVKPETPKARPAAPACTVGGVAAATTAVASPAVVVVGGSKKAYEISVITKRELFQISKPSRQSQQGCLVSVGPLYFLCFLKSGR